MKFYDGFAKNGKISVENLGKALYSLPRFKKNSQMKKVTHCGSIRINQHKFLVLIRDNMTCSICGARATRLGMIRDSNDEKIWNIRAFTENSWLNVDHWLPKTNGGNNTDQNLRATCQKCNAERGNTTTLQDLEEMIEFGIHKLVKKNVQTVRVDITDVLENV